MEGEWATAPEGREMPKASILSGFTYSTWNVRIGALDISGEAEAPVSYAAPESFSYPICFPLDSGLLPGLAIKTPLWLTLNRDDEGCFTVVDEWTIVFGMGESPSEAVAEYATALHEYYWLCARDAHAGKPGAKEHLVGLQNLLGSLTT